MVKVREDLLRTLLGSLKSTRGLLQLHGACRHQLRDLSAALAVVSKIHGGDEKISVQIQAGGECSA